MERIKFLSEFLIVTECDTENYYLGWSSVAFHGQYQLTEENLRAFEVRTIETFFNLELFMFQMRKIFQRLLSCAEVSFPTTRLQLMVVLVDSRIPLKPTNRNHHCQSQAERNDFGLRMWRKENGEVIFGTAVGEFDHWKSDCIYRLTGSQFRVTVELWLIERGIQAKLTSFSFYIPI